MTTEGLVFMCYRLHGVMVTAVLPPNAAAHAIAAAIGQGADHHFVQGIWDTDARRYREPPGTGLVVLPPQAVNEFEDLEQQELL